ncbi:hypothetical protein BGW42_003746 [Actinomortierella wolfii]|nr:hypothetical protein BGW42_003746 [Actinomortierella wolfii]
MSFYPSLIARTPWILVSVQDIAIWDMNDDDVVYMQGKAREGRLEVRCDPLHYNVHKDDIDRLFSLAENDKVEVKGNWEIVYNPGLSRFQIKLIVHKARMPSNKFSDIRLKYANRGGTLYKNNEVRKLQQMLETQSKLSNQRDRLPPELVSLVDEIPLRTGEKRNMAAMMGTDDDNNQQEGRTLPRQTIFDEIDNGNTGSGRPRNRKTPQRRPLQDVKNGGEGYNNVGTSTSTMGQHIWFEDSDKENRNNEGSSTSTKPQRQHIKFNNEEVEISNAGRSQSVTENLNDAINTSLPNDVVEDMSDVDA